MEFTFSTGQIIAIASGIVVINSACMAIITWAQRLTQPNRSREKRVKELEKDVTKIETEIQEIKEGSKVSLKALLALLESGINGDNIDGLQEAKETVDNYLINR